jgi:hypothetical protein
VKGIHALVPLFVAGAVAWALALPAAAVVAAWAPHGSGWHVASRLVYLAGSVVCHQRPERSFHLAGIPLPVCARCVGIYAGAGVAALVISALVAPGPATGREDPSPADVGLVRRLLLWAVVPSAATLLWEWTTGSTPANVVRACAGLPIGGVVTWIVMRSAQPDRQSG